MSAHPRVERNVVLRRAPGRGGGATTPEGRGCASLRDPRKACFPSCSFWRHLAFHCVK